MLVSDLLAGTYQDDQGKKIQLMTVFGDPRIFAGHVGPNKNLQNVDLADADLSNADLQGADLKNADLRNANLRLRTPRQGASAL